MHPSSPPSFSPPAAVMARGQNTIPPCAQDRAHLQGLRVCLQCSELGEMCPCLPLAFAVNPRALQQINDFHQGCRSPFNFSLQSSFC